MNWSNLRWVSIFLTNSIQFVSPQIQVISSPQSHRKENLPFASRTRKNKMHTVETAQIITTHGWRKYIEHHANECTKPLAKRLPKIKCTERNQIVTQFLNEFTCSPLEVCLASGSQFTFFVITYKSIVSIDSIDGTWCDVSASVCKWWSRAKKMWIVYYTTSPRVS